VAVAGPGPDELPSLQTFNYVNPLIAIAYALTGFRVERLPPDTATDADTTGEPGAPGTAPPTEAEDANLEGDPR
jgi:hypothetical protein